MGPRADHDGAVPLRGIAGNEGADGVVEHLGISGGGVVIAHDHAPLVRPPHGGHVDEGAVFKIHPDHIGLLLKVHGVQQRIQVQPGHQPVRRNIHAVILGRDRAVRPQQEQAVQIAVLGQGGQGVVHRGRSAQLRAIFHPPADLLRALRQAQQALGLGGQVDELAVVALLLHILHFADQLLLRGGDVVVRGDDEHHRHQQNANQYLHGDELPPAEGDFFSFHLRPPDTGPGRTYTRSEQPGWSRPPSSPSAPRPALCSGPGCRPCQRPPPGPR